MLCYNFAGQRTFVRGVEKLAAGDRVAILLHNSVEWVCFDQAALSLGLVVVPLFTPDAPASSPASAVPSVAAEGTTPCTVALPQRWGAALDEGLGHRRPQPAVGGVGDLPRGQPAHVDDPVGAGHAQFQQVDEVGAAGEEDRVGLGGDGGHGLGGVGRPGEGERLHATPPACCTAGTMLA